MKKSDLEGQVFGRLTVLKKIDERQKKHVVYKCLCECGKIKNIFSNSLRSGNTKSCGCLQKEIIRTIMLKHGYTMLSEKEPTYAAWDNMIQRCENPRHPSYHNYGGRGIKVCNQWKTFKTFLKDMGKKPKGLAIDRIENDGDYEPGNCRWITKKENSRNRRDTKLTVRGVKRIKQLLKTTCRTQKEIAKLYGVSRFTISAIKMGKAWPDIKI